MSSSWVVYDDSTGEILKILIGNESLAIANTPAGYDYIDGSGLLLSGNTKYVDLSGTPTADDRPLVTATIPTTVTAGATLSITPPAGTTITIYSETAEVVRGSGSGGSLFTYNTGIGDGIGDYLTVTIEGFPYITRVESVLLAP